MEDKVLIIGTGEIKSMMTSLETKETIIQQRLDEPEPIIYKAMPELEPIIYQSFEPTRKHKTRKDNMQSPKKHKRKKSRNGKSKKK